MKKTIEKLVSAIPLGLLSIILLLPAPLIAAEQITVEAKFIESSKGAIPHDLAELAKTKGIDLLGSPRVTTISGQQAQIEVIREYQPASVEPPGFQPVHLGIILRVTPRLKGDRIAYTAQITVRELITGKPQGEQTCSEFTTRDLYVSGAPKDGEAVWFDFIGPTHGKKMVVWLQFKHMGAFADEPVSPSREDIDKDIPLAEAVRVFNQRYGKDPIGKDQPALTEEAVVAAIRWAMLDRQKLLVSDETFRILGGITETRTLPRGFELEALTGYEPNDRVTFDVWSVRLRIPGGPIPHGTTCIVIQEKMIRSRIIGEAERKVIHAWWERKRGGIPSMQRAEWGRQEREERQAAAAGDNKERK